MYRFSDFLYITLLHMWQELPLILLQNVSKEKKFKHFCNFLLIITKKDLYLCIILNKTL